MKIKQIIKFITVLLISYSTFGAISEQSFNKIINEFRNSYTSLLRYEGYRLKFKANWRESKILASIKVPKGNAILTISGGFAKQATITEDTFRIVICHEMGHVLGGAPKKSPIHWASVEGQADYYSTSKCMKKILPDDEQRDDRIKAAILRLGKLGAKDGGNDPEKISLESKDTHKVRSTYTLHSKPQCRVDTMLAGLTCPISDRENFSEKDVNRGACLNKSSDILYRQGARPRCWYRPPTPLLRCASKELLPLDKSKIPLVILMLEDFRDDKTMAAELMVGVALVQNRYRNRLVELDNGHYSSSKLELIKTEKDAYKVLLDEELFNQLKDKSLIRHTWDGFKPNTDEKGRVILNVTCSNQ